MFHSKLRRHAAVSAALLIAVSCGDNPAGIAPAKPGLQRVETGAASQRRDHVARGLLVRRDVHLDDDVSATATITPEGGFLTLREAGLLLYFPSGAVSHSIAITATARKGNRVVYDFQPHGLTFATPIYVAQSLAATELDTQRGKKTPDVWAGYLDHDDADLHGDGSARFSETFDVFFQGTGRNALAVFTITHFSGYAMASGRREAVPPLL